MGESSGPESADGFDNRNLSGYIADRSLCRPLRIRAPHKRSLPFPSPHPSEEKERTLGMHEISCNQPHQTDPTGDNRRPFAQTERPVLLGPESDCIDLTAQSWNYAILSDSTEELSLEAMMLEDNPLIRYSWSERPFGVYNQPSIPHPSVMDCIKLQDPLKRHDRSQRERRDSCAGTCCSFGWQQRRPLHSLLL